MTTIPTSGVTPVAQGPATPAAPASATTAVVTEYPAGWQNSSPGSVITGTVISRDSHGQTLLQTDAGAVTFKTAANLAVGAQVTLQVQIAGSQLQAVILAARAPAAAVAGGPGLTSLPPTATAAATIATSIGQGPLVVATVIGPSAGGTAFPATGASSVPYGAAAPVSAAAGSGSQAAPHPTTGAPQSPPATPATLTALQATASPTLAPPGVNLPTRVGVGPATAPAASPPAALPPGTVSPSVPVPSAASSLSSVVLAAAVATSTSVPPAPPQASVGAGAVLPATPAPMQPSRPVAAAVATYSANAGGAGGGGPAAGFSASPSVGMPAGPASIAAHPEAEGGKSFPGLPVAPTGAQLQMRYIGPTMAPAMAGALVATVLGRTPAGQTILDTALGRLALNLPAGVGAPLEGSLLAFSVVSASRPTTAAASFAAAQNTQSLSLGREWPALKAAMAVLAETDPPLLRQLQEISLPRPGHARFLGQVLSYVASPSADARSLLGDAALAVLDRAGRHDLVLRLDADLREAARANATGSDWRMFFVPILDANEMRQLRLFTRRQAPARDREREGSGRFIVEVEFDELGPLQIDGLVQKPRIDLILRSHAELPQDMRTGIMDVFEKTCGAAGLNGQIFFQAVAAFPVSPLEEIAKGSRPGVEI